MLREDLVEHVLARLGFASRPEPSHATLAAIYEKWCRHVPFDNLRKLIHVRAGDPGTLPGDSPAEFFEAWLRHGVGGTCWAGNGALCELLLALGFDARRAAATMLVAPNLPPNHGSVVVHLPEGPFVVDASILFVVPLPMRAGAAIEHPAWGVTTRLVDDRFTVRWLALQLDDRLDCRFDRFAETAASFSNFHEATRAWSPFNYEIHVNLVRGDGRIAACHSEKVTVDGEGTVRRVAISGESRKRFLVDEVGISEEIADRLPADLPVPPPPGSRTAAR